MYTADMPLKEARDWHRHLLRTPDLADAPLDDILRLAVPLIRALLATPPPAHD